MAEGRSWFYKNTTTTSEGQLQPTYCIAFNFIDLHHKNIFASCGGTRATIYNCREDGELEVLQAYIDESRSEEFFVCKWTRHETSGAALLLVAGKLGVVQVLDTSSQTLHWTAVGHGDSINDIAVHPTKTDLFLTASRDQSLRLWNLKTRTCVLVVTGDEGHTNEVLSIDFHPTDGSRFISAGMDNTIKLWSLLGARKDIENSFKHDQGNRKSFPTGKLAAPAFSTHKVHWNYVDCVRWLGDLILSKSVDSRVLLWRPLLDQKSAVPAHAPPRYDTKGHVHLVQEFLMEDADIWFMRFSLDYQANTMACGNRLGRIYVWDLSSPNSQPVARLKVIGKDKQTVRQTAVSYDGSIILACCDDGSISRFDLISVEDAAEPTADL